MKYEIWFHNQMVKTSLKQNGFFETKLNEQGEVITDKFRLVAQGYIQKEDIDCTETFALIARQEAIRLSLSYVVNNGIILYQMNVKMHL